VRPDHRAPKVEGSRKGVCSLRSTDSHWWDKIAVNRLENLNVIWQREEDMCPGRMVMLYVASTLSQSHRAGAMWAPRPDSI
jgi:hypothetical protein